MKIFLIALVMLLFLIMIVPVRACLTGADINCDDTINMTELNNYIQEWYLCSGCVGDLFEAIEGYYEGAVIPPCTNDPGCSATGSFCDGNKLYTCSLEDGCLKRSDGIDCGAGKVCSGGECFYEGVCGNGLKEPGENCDDGSSNGNIGFCNTDCDGLVGNYYVSIDDPSCSDEGPGTSERPWCTITRAQNYKDGYVPDGYDPMVQDGDFVVVRNGNYGAYDENNGQNPRLKWHIYRNDWITYKADAGHTPVLDMVYIRNEDAWPDDGDENGRNYVIIDGFRIKNGVKILYSGYVKILNSNITKEYYMPYDGYHAPYFYPNVHIVSIQSGSKHIYIENNDIWGNTRPISAEKNDYIFIINNSCHHIGEDGINANSNHVIIENNTIYDINQYRTSFPITGTLTGTFIENETVIQPDTGAEGLVVDVLLNGVVAIQTNNGRFLKKSHGGGTVIGQESGATIDDVYVDYAHTDSIQIHSNVTNLTIKNNIIRRDEGGQGLKMVGPDNVRIENNLIYTTVPLYWSGTEGGITMVNNTLVIPVGSSPSSGGAPAVGYEGKESNNMLMMENNIITRWVLADDRNDLGLYSRVFEHSKNIFGNNPDGTGGYLYPFKVNFSSELVDYDVDSLFVNPAGFDYRVRMGTPACDGSVNGMPEVAVGALPCVCLNDDDCVFGGSCVDGECVGTKACFGNDASCGAFPNCQNCDWQDGCYGSKERDYSCSGSSCTYSSHDCTSCACSCGGYGVPEANEMDNCDDGKDNDCDGSVDGSDYGCQSLSGIPMDFVTFFRFEGNIKDYHDRNTGTWIGGDPSFEKRNGNSYAVIFNGIDQYIDAPNNDDFHLNESFTISVWVKPEKTSSAAVIAKGTIEQTPYMQYNIFTRGSEDTVRFYGEISNNEIRETVSTGQDYSLGSWQHVALRFDGSALSIFINGVEINSLESDFSALIVPLGSFNTVRIGNERHSRYFFDGSIDDMLIYKRALTNTEITQIYEAQK